MSEVGQREALTQQRLLRLFQDRLGYEYLGNWQHRAGNANIEWELLEKWLRGRGTGDAALTRLIRVIEQAAAIGGNQQLYDANKAFYGLLRYGAKVQVAAGVPTETVWLIDWDDPEKNDFAVAEEVAVLGHHNRRPDLVLYVNGIALGVIELKRSTVSLAEGISQNISNQDPRFIQPFFSTIQLLMAGNDTEGLRYGVIGSLGQDYLAWKEPSEFEGRLDAAVDRLCRKERFLELLHDFIAFDGEKKIARPNQYFGVKAAQQAARDRKGGIIWHMMGSGKSMIMVWLARWLREKHKARVLIITDRIDLDDQIQTQVFQPAGEKITRTKTAKELFDVLNRDEDWFICSLVHKFGRAEGGDVDNYVEELTRNLPRDFQPKGDIFVFVDECHRTQSGKLHSAMKRFLPDAVFFGFTGTPLLRMDKKTSIETFGPYIHTYKYDEAVADGVVVDLVYEARHIEQELLSPERVDEWFDAKTQGMTDYAKAQLKKRWGTVQALMSSRERLRHIVADIDMDMVREPRLANNLGNAMLVAGSIYEAYRLYEMFQETDLKGKCAVVTSYRPAASELSKALTGEGRSEAELVYATSRKMLAEHFNEPEDVAAAKIEEFEEQVKLRFKKEPARMKLLIVVDRLLVGFDARPATFLYIDHPMRDHRLFQAVCRVNRKHTEDKTRGVIVDYRELFKALARSVNEYTGDAFEGFDPEDIKGVLKGRLEHGRESLDEAREAAKVLVEPVAPARDSLAYIRYFAPGMGAVTPEEFSAAERRRHALYAAATRYARAYADLANDMTAAGYTPREAAAIRGEVDHFAAVSQEMKLASGDGIDLGAYEPKMRQLLDTYVTAKPSEELAGFGDKPLLELLAEQGEAALEKLPAGLRANQEAIAEAIENNIRKVIIDAMAMNPKHYAKMSALLDALIQKRKQQAAEYKAYLAELIAMYKRVRQPEMGGERPPSINTAALAALYDHLGDERLSINVDRAIRENRRDGWRGNRAKERELMAAVGAALGEREAERDAVFELVEAHADAY